MSSAAVQVEDKLTRKDFDAGIDVRWCPGCADYAVLASVQRLLPKFGVPPEKIAFISGIGCSSRFPYYMGTNGFHTIHGRAPTFATGLKVSRPDLDVWMITGDGDALSIGGNHFIHVLRRNVDINVLLFNNRIYGLTKGQYSPTTYPGLKTKSSPMGSIDHPLSPVNLALGADASFVARGVATESKVMTEILTAAHEHRGTSFVEIFQNCVIFADNVFGYFADKKVKEDFQLYLKDGEPMIYGKEKNKGLMLEGRDLKAVTIGEDGITEADILVHKVNDPDPSMAFRLAHLDAPEFPVAMGILRKVDRPTYNDAVNEQVELAIEQKGKGDLAEMLRGNDTWTVE